MLSGNGLTFTRFIIAVNRTDMRLGIDGLSALIRLRYGMDPLEKGTLNKLTDEKEGDIREGTITLTSNLKEGVSYYLQMALPTR